MTKHEQIVSYIESLNIGQKISVRKIAKVMNVSEGTAYRAIKDASQLGFVTTIDRVGTVRIDKKSREQIEHLTFQEIVNIIEGDIISGKSGLNKTVSKFAIGAMELKDVVKYIGNQTLLIVGNRPEVQMEALKRGSGILITGGFSTAQNIIDYKEENGPIKHHKEISRIKRLGAKTFEQSIGFLRIVDGKEPLDNTAIHPESYDVAYRMLHQLDLTAQDIGSVKLKNTLSNVNISTLVSQLNIGEPTLKDIIQSLIAPNRDPRDEFETPILKSDVLSIEDLSKGMKLNGTVRNVVDFGAFVDIGVKQDGLVHISKLSKKFVKNPMDMISVGDIVEVWILDIDENKGKVSLTMVDPNE